jgi:hypothetical protein
MRSVPLTGQLRPPILAQWIVAAGWANDPGPSRGGLGHCRGIARKTARFCYRVEPLARAGHFMRGKIPSRLLRKIVAKYLGLHRVRL